MIFDPASASHLKPWLVRTLEPICDAEPGALADYILALLKHNVPESEMRKELAAQLDEFLEKECPPFVDTLFTVLRTKSYLPYAASPSTPSFSSDTGIPIPLDGLLSPSIPTSPDRGRKRSIENDERDGRPPAKGPRISSEGQFSRYANGNGGRLDIRSTGGWGGRGERPPMNGYGSDGFGPGMGPMNSMNMMNGRRPQAYQPPDQKRGICRDYHNNGYCARGALCKYSHGDDAVVPGQMYPGPTISGPGLPFMPMFPDGRALYGVGGGTGTAYDPHEARMDMRPPTGGRPHQRAPLLPRVQQEGGSQVVHNLHASGELPVIQDLTPALPPDAAKAQESTQPQSQESQSSQQLPTQHQSHVNHREGYEHNAFAGLSPMGMNGQPFMGMSGPMDVEMGPPMQIAPQMNNQQNGGFRGGMRGGGRGRGTFGGDAHNFRPERRNDKTLVVEKIPDDKLTLDLVNAWFKRFGTVTNVAIDAGNAKALVSFSNHEEAHAAWKSEDAVFNNRFVKLFWHRPMEGHGQVGARMLAASAPLVANMSTKEIPTRSVAGPSAPMASTSTPRKLATPSAAAAALALKQQLLEQQIAEQKSLMASLGTASANEKKEIMARLRKLGEEMKPLSPTPTAASASPIPSAAKTLAKPGDREEKERERLDKELEIHNASVTVDEEDSAEDLKAKLERLKAEAASLGLADATSEAGHGGGAYRPYRGRGRGGRSYYRGATRGGPPRASMKLDNRPKKLVVKGVREDAVQALRDWYEASGQVESLETSDNGDVTVAFKSRAAAEQGLVKGTSIPSVGSVQIAWHTGKQTSSTQATTKSAPPQLIDAAETHVEPTREHSSLHSPHIQDEEVTASGWGGDGDGEDGMGML